MIKKILTFSLLLLWSCASLPAQTEAAYRLIERMAPGYSKQFLLEQIPAENGADVYEIGSKDGKVLLRGNNPVAMATAFNQYLKYTCNAHVSWMGDHMDLPHKLPCPKRPPTTPSTENTASISTTAPSAIPPPGGTGNAGSAKSTTWP